LDRKYQRTAQLITGDDIVLKRHVTFSAAIRCCGFFLLVQMAAANAADLWQPRRPIEIVSPSAPGGGLDLVARTLQYAIQQQKLSSKPVNVQNRPGGGGTVGIAYINSHPGDGHYVSIQALSLITNSLTGISTLGLDDVTPLAVVVTDQIVFAVSAGSSIKTGKQLVDLMKKDPSAVSIGVSGAPGSQSHDAAALVARASGIDPSKLKIVFFDSGGDAVTSLAGEHVNTVVVPAAVGLGASQSGLVRLLAIAADHREPGALSDVPTWKEQGVNIESSTWRALVGPKNMTPVEIAWWDNVLQKATSSPEWAVAVKRNLWTPDYMNSTQTRMFLKNEQSRLTPLLQSLGLAK
jgi:putative tricarboxylic transport membrane protein